MPGRPAHSSRHPLAIFLLSCTSARPIPEASPAPPGPVVRPVPLLQPIFPDADVEPGTLTVPDPGGSLTYYDLEGRWNTQGLYWTKWEVEPSAEGWMAWQVHPRQATPEIPGGGYSRMNRGVPAELAAWLAIEDFYRHHSMSASIDADGGHRTEGRTRDLERQTGESRAVVVSRDTLRFSPSLQVRCESVMEIYAEQGQDYLSPYDRAVRDFDQDIEKVEDLSWARRDQLDLGDHTDEIALRHWVEPQDDALIYTLAITLSREMNRHDGRAVYAEDQIRCTGPRPLFVQNLESTQVQMGLVGDDWYATAWHSGEAMPPTPVSP